MSMLKKYRLKLIRERKRHLEKRIESGDAKLTVMRVKVIKP